MLPPQPSLTFISVFLKHSHSSLSSRTLVETRFSGPHPQVILIQWILGEDLRTCTSNEPRWCWCCPQAHPWNNSAPNLLIFSGKFTQPKTQSPALHHRSTAWKSHVAFITLATLALRGHLTVSTTRSSVTTSVHLLSMTSPKKRFLNKWTNT